MSSRYSIKSIVDDLALPELAYAFKLAVGPTKLLLMLVAVAIISGFGWFLDNISRSVVSHPRAPEMNCGKNGVKLLVRTELEVWLVAPDAIYDFVERYGKQYRNVGVFSTLWRFASDRFDDSIRQLFDFRKSGFVHNISYLFYNLWLCLLSLGWAIRFHPFYSLLFFTVALLIISFAGGAVCRCAALEYAQNEKPGLIEAVCFAKEHYRALLTAPLIPVLLMLPPALIVAAGGMILTIPYVGEVLFGLLFWLLAAAGLIMASLILAITAGGLLFWPAVAYERTSGRDALGRAICYVLNRPLWAIFYLFAAGLFGTFFYFLLRLATFLSLFIAHRIAGWAYAIWGHGGLKLQRIWPAPQFFSFLSAPSNPLNFSETLSVFFIRCFLGLIAGFFAAYLVNYLLCASTVVYALMRKRVDGVSVEQISTDLPKPASVALSTS